MSQIVSSPSTTAGRVAVAYSAGRDSTALLHATACAARAHPGTTVWALHVHHGLSAQADAWLAHAERTCTQWAEQGLPVRLLSRRVHVPLDAGDSVEALARDVRYEALADMAKGLDIEMILLAHHRRDQAETFLLQALRGAGVSGLAAMPHDVVRDGVRWVRPWLSHGREAIEAYVAQHGLHHVDDDSNARDRFARNRLRLSVWPSLEAAFPQAEQSLAMAARRVQDVLPGVASWRESLIQALALPDGRLDAASWSELSGAQRRESLMHWYRQMCGAALPATWVERLAHEVPRLVYQGKVAHWPEIGLGLYRGALQLLPASPPESMEELETVQICPLAIDAPGEHELAAWSNGRLRVLSVLSGGISPALLAGAEARNRQGAERFQLGPSRPPRSLKKQFQALGVPEWQRRGPLIWSGDQLVFVPGLGIDARCVAPLGSPQWGLEWVPAGR